MGSMTGDRALREGKSFHNDKASYNDKAFRNDGYAKVTGTGIFAADISLPNMLFGVPVFAPYVAATDLSIDTSDAEKYPGVVTILTADHVPGTLGGGPISKDIPIFTKDTIYSWGDVVALVIAESREIALTAAELITQEATPVDPILSMDKALEESAREVYPEMAPHNRVNHHHLQHGEHLQPLEGVERVITQKFSTQMVEHAYMEPEAVVAVPRYDGVYEIYGSIQHLFSIQRMVSSYLKLSLADIEVQTVLTGGSFGGKDENMGAIAARAVLGSMVTKRPVSIVYSREWSIRESYKRHPFEMDYSFGFSRDGYLQGAKVELLAESGAYTSVTPWVTWRSIAQCCGPYVIPNVRADSWGVATNRCYTGAMRGFGSPQVNFAIEQMMDISAGELGISPVEIRRKNMVQQGSETITGQILDNHIVSMESVMDTVLEAIEYDKKYAKCSHGSGDTMYGIGFAISYRGSSIGAEGFDFSAATLNGLYDGSILLETGIQENGQGAESAMLLVAAEELGVKLERIRYRRSRTSTIPDSGNTVASRGTLMGTSAVVRAATKFKELVATHIAPLLGSREEEVLFHDDRIWGRGDTCSISWEEALSLLLRKRIHLHVTETFHAPDVSWVEETGQGKAYFTYVYSCQAVEVEVSRKTGKITPLKIVAAHDIGRAINRKLLEGQVHGGIVQALGYALGEDVGYTVEGEIESLNFQKYKIPRITDVPPIEVILIENNDPNSLTGAKGIGEPATELLMPALANAIYQATGKRCTDLPITIHPEDFHD